MFNQRNASLEAGNERASVQRRLITRIFHAAHATFESLDASVPFAAKYLKLFLSDYLIKNNFCSVTLNFEL